MATIRQTMASKQSFDYLKDKNSECSRPAAPHQTTIDIIIIIAYYYCIILSVFHQL
jgi:hypothetical protein